MTVRARSAGRGVRRRPAAPAQSAPASRALTDAEVRRYSRHLLVPEVGFEGQRRLRDGKVLIVGAGGLGAPSSLYLAAAGVGTLGLVDFDAVAESNLQRQVLYRTCDVGRPKLEAAAERLGELNPGVRVVRHDVALDPSNATGILSGYDVIVDGTDNYPARYLVNDVCVRLGKPDVFGSVYPFEGQASVFHAPAGPCYRCLFPEPPPPEAAPSCAEAGVLGVLPGLVGMVQATEAVKLLLQQGTSLLGRLLVIDALAMRFRELRIERDPDCRRCSEGRRNGPIEPVAAYCDPTEADPTLVPSLSVETLRQELDGPAPPMLIDVREPAEYALGRHPGSVLIPHGELEGRSGEIGGAPSVVVYCKMGVRSSRAARLLLDLGFPKVRTLRGGLDAWAARIDPTVRPD